MLIVGLIIAMALYFWKSERLFPFGDSGAAACLARELGGSPFHNVLNPLKDQFEINAWQVIRHLFGDEEHGAPLATAVCVLGAMVVTSLTAHFLFGSLTGGLTALFMALYFISRRLESFTYPAELFLLLPISLALNFSIISIEPGAIRQVLGLSLDQASWLAITLAIAAGVLSGLLLLWHERSLPLVGLIGLAMAVGPNPRSGCAAYLLGVALTLCGSGYASGRFSDASRLLKRRVVVFSSGSRTRLETHGAHGAQPVAASSQQGMNALRVGGGAIFWHLLPLVAATVIGLLVVFQHIGQHFGWLGLGVETGLFAGIPAAYGMVAAAYLGSCFLMGREARRPARIFLLLPTATLFAGLAVRDWETRLHALAGPTVVDTNWIAALNIFDNLSVVILAGSILAFVATEVRFWIMDDPIQLATLLWGPTDARTIELKHRNEVIAYLFEQRHVDAPVLVRGISGFPVLQSGRELAAEPSDGPVIIIAPAHELWNERASAASGLPYRLDRILEHLSIYRASTQSGEVADALMDAAAAESAGKHAEARVAYERARRSDPWCPEAHIGLGRSLLASGLFDECLKSLEMTVELSPDSPIAAEALFLKGLALVNLGCRDEGRQSLLEANVVLPAQTDILKALGQLERDDGAFAGAAERFERIAQIGNLPIEQRREASLTAAKCHLEAGQWERARNVAGQWAQPEQAGDQGPAAAGIIAECERMQRREKAA